MGREASIKTCWTGHIFMGVKLDAESHTLFWDGLIKMKDASGRLFNTTRDIDPEVLYEMSKPVNELRHLDNKAA